MDLGDTQFPRATLHGLTTGKYRPAGKYQNVVHSAAAIATLLEHMFKKQMGMTTDGTSPHFADLATTERMNLRSIGISFQFRATSNKGAIFPIPHT